MEKLSQTKTILMFMAKNGGMLKDRDALLHPINNVFNYSRKAISNALYTLKLKGLVDHDDHNEWYLTHAGWDAAEDVIICYYDGLYDKVDIDDTKQSDDLAKQLDEMKLKLDDYEQRLAEKDEEIKHLKEQQQVSHVDVDASINSNLEKTFKHLAETFKILQQSFTYV